MVDDVVLANPQSENRADDDVIRSERGRFAPAAIGTTFHAKSRPSESFLVRLVVGLLLGFLVAYFLSSIVRRLVRFVISSVSRFFPTKIGQP